MTLVAAGLAALVLAVVPGSLALGSPTLVKDIDPNFLTNVNGTLFFSAYDQTHDFELWKSNGSEAGTQLVKDINPSGGSVPSWLTNVNGTLFFFANGGGCYCLWKSDGEEAGTVLVKEGTGSPPGDSNALRPTSVGGTFYFMGWNASGEELWRSDGTEAGTYMVKDIGPSGGSVPRWLTNVNGTLFFQASDPTYGQELWKSDGTEAGTVVIDIVPGSGSSIPQRLVNVDGTVFFDTQINNQYALWKSDGTPAGTQFVKAIRPSNLINVNGTAFFAANDGTNGPELWKSDGTPGGTQMVKDINPGPGGGVGGPLLNINGTLFFAATDGANGSELWKSDGTDAGTQLVKDIEPGPGSSSPDYLANAGGTLIFDAFDSANGWEPWQSDGTEAGTSLLGDINPGPGFDYSSFPGPFTLAGPNVFFPASDGSGGPGRITNKLWKVATTPTAVKVGALTARRVGPEVVLRWRTRSETDVLGFNIFRERRGLLTKLNQALIHTAAGGTARGHAYSWLDRRPPRTSTNFTYRLQAVHRDGMRSWVGAASLRR